MNIKVTIKYPNQRQELKKIEVLIEDNEDFNLEKFIDLIAQYGILTMNKEESYMNIDLNLGNTKGISVNKVFDILSTCSKF